MRDLGANDLDGQKELDAILAFFVYATKEFRRFHVLLCSSDGFVHNWLCYTIGNDRFNTVVIGHLSKDEAAKYWRDEVTSNGFHGRDSLEFEAGELYLSGICTLNSLYYN